MSVPHVVHQTFRHFQNSRHFYFLKSGSDDFSKVLEEKKGNARSWKRVCCWGVVEAVVETSERQAFDVEGLPRGYIYTHTHTWLSLSSSSSYIIIFKSFSLDAILDVVRRHLVRCKLLDILEFIQI